MSCKQLVVIGVSTGGPRALRQLFTGMPRLAAGIVLVQHMPKFVNASFRKTLDAMTEMDVVIAEHHSNICMGTIHIAPSEVHLVLRDNQRISLVQGPKVDFVKPSIDVAMISTQRRKGCRVVGIVLTGMGRDGSEGIRHIKEIGGVTIAQDARSCTIYGMPKAAAETGDIDFVLSPEEIRDYLIGWAGISSQTHLPHRKNQLSAIDLKGFAAQDNLELVETQILRNSPEADCQTS